MFKGLFSVVISIECLGVNFVGKYYNVVGLDVIELEVK